MQEDTVAAQSHGNLATWALLLAIAVGASAPALAQVGPDMAPAPFAVSAFAAADDHVTFDILKARARSLAAGTLSHVAIQGLDATVYVKHLTVHTGGRATEIPVRRPLVPGEGTGPIDLRSDGATVRAITVHIQANAQANALAQGRIALYVPAGSAAAATIVSGTPSGDNPGARPDGAMTPVARYTALPGADRHALRLGMAKGRFASLVLRIQEGAIGLNAVRILYNTGEVQMVPFGRPFGAGDQTREIVLERDAFIAEIQFALAPLTASRAVLDLYGTYADGWTGENGESKTYTAGWVMLGIRRATRDHLAQNTGVPEDARVAPGLGRFKKLRFVARDGSMSLGAVTVLFDDGERSTVQVGQGLLRDQTSQPVSIENSGRGRGIAAIQLPPASKVAARRDGYVEVWGQN